MSVRPTLSEFQFLAKAFTYTVMSTERLLAMTDKPVLGNLPVRRDKCLEYTMRCLLTASKASFYNEKAKKAHSLEMRLIGNGLLTSLFPGCIKGNMSYITLLMAQWVDMEALENKNHASLLYFFDSLGAILQISSLESASSWVVTHQHALSA